MNLNESIQSIKESVDEMARLAKQHPESVICWKPAEDKWSILEILCHMDEAIPYWLEEIRRLAVTPEAEWGRGLQDEARLNAVAQAEQRSLDDVLQDLAKSKQQIATVLGSLSDDQLAAESPSRNPRFGVKPLSFIIDHLLVEHATKHVGQIQRNLRELKEEN
jgi:uncharacterized damage-inducible protein DinB